MAKLPQYIVTTTHTVTERVLIYASDEEQADRLIRASWRHDDEGGRMKLSTETSEREVTRVQYLEGT